MAECEKTNMSVECKNKKAVDPWLRRSKTHKMRLSGRTFIGRF